MKLPLRRMDCNCQSCFAHCNEVVLFEGHSPTPNKYFRTAADRNAHTMANAWLPAGGQWSEEVTAFDGGQALQWWYCILYYRAKPIYSATVDNPVPAIDGPGQSIPRNRYSGARS